MAMRWIGLALWVLGIATFVIGFRMEVSVPSTSTGLYGINTTDRIVNTGLLQDQLLIILVGGMLFIAGVIVQSIGELGMMIRGSVGAAAEAATSDEPYADTRLDGTRARIPAYPITHPSEAELPHIGDIRLLGIQRCDDGKYRAGSRDFETLEAAISAARQGTGAPRGMKGG